MSKSQSEIVRKPQHRQPKVHFNQQFSLQLHGHIEKDYVFVLRRLLVPQRINRSLTLIVPETVCFLNGEPKVIVYTQGKQIKYIKEKYSLQQIRHFMNAKRKRPNEDKSREAVIVNYHNDRDKNDRGHVLSEFEFINLMMKQKLDPYWKNIQFIQNFVRPKNYHVIQVKFSRNHTDALFRRAMIESRILNREIVVASSEYISQEDDNAFKATLPIDILCRYLCYKIVWYIEIFYGSVINEGLFEFYKDDNEPVFQNAFGIKYTQGEEAEFLTEDWYFNNLEEQAQKKLRLKPKHLKFEVSQRSQEIQSKMVSDFEYLVKEVGITEDSFKIVSNDEISSSVFRVLHPDSTLDFGTIMHNPRLYTTMSKQLFRSRKNDQYMQSKMLSTNFMSATRRIPPYSTFSRFEVVSEMNRSIQRRPKRAVSDYRMPDSRKTNRSNKRTLTNCLGLTQY